MSTSRLRVTAAFVVAGMLAAALPAGVGATPSKIPTTLSIATSPNPAWVGETVTVTFTVTPIPDGGYVTRGGEGIPVDPTTGTATITQTYPSAGGWVMSAWYMGTDIYAPSPSTSVTTTVQQHPVSATLTVPADPIGRGDGFDVTVTLDGVPDGGNVSIRRVNDAGEPLSGFLAGGAPVDGTMPMTIPVPGQEPGTYKVRAFFGGTAAWASAASEIESITVFDRPTVTTATIAPNPSKWGEATTVAITVAPAPDDGGAVRISRDGSNIGWATMSWSTGTGTFDLPTAYPGDHPVLAEFLPSAYIWRWGPSEASVTQTVGTVPVDTDAPVGSVSINDGAALTTEGYVVVSRHATDASYIQSVEIGCDTVEWVYGGPINGDIGWGFGGPGCSPQQGIKTVYVRWTDAYDNVGIASDSIILENAPPAGTIVITDGSSHVASPIVSLNVSASDPATGVAEVALSNDGTDWTTRTYAPIQPWTLNSADGTKTVYVKWRDGYGHWSAATTDTIVLDRTAPNGAIAIAGGAPSTRGTAVTLSVPATDVHSGATHVALSNDGTTWTTRTYAPTQPWTLSSANGLKTVWAKWRDAVGNWSAPRSDSIVLDTVAPTATVPTHGFPSGIALSTGRLPVRLSWTGSDATSGVARYEVSQQVDGGTWSGSTSVTSSALSPYLAHGHTYRFKVRTVDGAGNVGSWAYGLTFRLLGYTEAAGTIRYSGAWTNVASTAYWGGAARAASAAGSRAVFTFTGRAVAWVSLKAPTRGKAAIYVNGTYLATVDLYAPSSQVQRVIWTREWSTSASRTVEIRVLGTSGRARIDVDGFFVGR